MRANILTRAVAAAVACAPAAASSAEPAAGTVALVTGDAFVARDGRLLRAVPSMRLVRGDRVLTRPGGGAAVTLRRGCTLVVGGNAWIGVRSCGEKAAGFSQAGAGAGVAGRGVASGGAAGGGAVAVAVAALVASVLGIVGAASTGGQPNSP